MKAEAREQEIFRTTANKRRGGADYIWLAYSVFFFIGPAIRKSAEYWMKSLVIFAIFLVMYAVYVEARRWRWARPAMVAGIAALGLGTIQFNEGSSSFLIFAAAMLPFAIESMALVAVLIGVEALLVGVEWWLVRTNSINYAIAGAFVIAVGAGNIFAAQQKRADCRLRAMQEENIALAGVAERERIARDLHDVLGHTLSVIVLKAELAGRLIGTNNERAAAEIADVERTARTALAEVRETITGFRTKGLMAEVEQARRTLDAAGVALECESAPPALGATAETVLSLAVREAVTNIVRHAGATRCTMRFASTDDGFSALTVEDDGRGANVGMGKGEGNGLRGMRDRVQALGGRLRVESGWMTVGGTRLIVELPWTPDGVSG